MSDQTGENDQDNVQPFPSNEDAREPYSYPELAEALREPRQEVEPFRPSVQYNFQGVDTTSYVITLARFMAAQSRFLSQARLQSNPVEYNTALEQYSLAQGMMIGACQELLHQLGVI